ncbi:MAG TPA: hypothetical protein VFT72_11415 [Opitutaceae bacterium]|nr:hypothetical protein [Opitutaceae bacterium]
MTPPEKDSPADAPPQVPGFKTWRGLYLFVGIVFLLTVAALALFSSAFA